MKHLAAVLFFLIVRLLPATGQDRQGGQSHNPGRVLSYQELLGEMLNCKDSIYRLSHATLQLDVNKDERFLSLDTRSLAALDTLTVKVGVEMEDVVIAGENPLVLSNIVFENPFSYLENTRSRNALVFNRVRFLSDLEVKMENESTELKLGFFESDFLGAVEIESSGAIYLEDCHFNDQELDHASDPVTWSIVLNNAESVLGMDNCRFHRRHKEDEFKFYSRDVYSIKLFDNEFDANFDLSESTIKDLTLNGNTFGGLVDLTNLEFGSAKSEFGLSPMSKRICVYSNGDTLWLPTTVAAFADTVAVERFFAVYRKLIDHYQIRGNRKAYNLTYTEMKDYETLYMHYDYRQNPNLENWFTWKMNQFLATFSDYGTTPVKAIIYALRVILYFALFFFLFGNEWDTITREKLMARIRLLSTYFRSPQSLAKLYTEQSKPKYESYEDFMRYMKEGETELPRFFRWLSKPLYRLSTVVIVLRNRVLRKTEFLDGKWVDMDKKRKRRTAFWTGIYLIGYIITAIVLRILNALTLSVNSFTTLGFGEIPTRGMARYGAIAEGFIGWFLLTIFSVSLISQLLQ